VRPKIAKIVPSVLFRVAATSGMGVGSMVGLKTVPPRFRGAFLARGKAQDESGPGLEIAVDFHGT